MKNKVLITGTSSGLGKHLVQKFENEGHEVFSHNGKKHYDLRNLSEVEELAEMVRLEDIKILINNAAIVCPNITLEKYNIAEICDMIDVNLRAPIVLIYLLLETLDNVININSMVGLEIKSPRTIYSATKWGLRGFSNSLKKENKEVKFLDVYPTNIKMHPFQQNAMNVELVVDEIYKSYIDGAEELVLDGRKL